MKHTDKPKLQVRINIISRQNIHLASQNDQQSTLNKSQKIKLAAEEQLSSAIQTSLSKTKLKGGSKISKFFEKMLQLQQLATTW